MANNGPSRPHKTPPQAPPETSESSTSIDILSQKLLQIMEGSKTVLEDALKNHQQFQQKFENKCKNFEAQFDANTKKIEAKHNALTQKYDEHAIRMKEHQKLLDAYGEILHEEIRLNEEEGKLLEKEGQQLDARDKLLEAHGEQLDKNGKLIDTAMKLTSSNYQAVKDLRQQVEKKQQADKHKKNGF